MALVERRWKSISNLEADEYVVKIYVGNHIILPYEHFKSN